MIDKKGRSIAERPFLLPDNANVVINYHLNRGEHIMLDMLEALPYRPGKRLKLRWWKKIELKVQREQGQ